MSVKIVPFSTGSVSEIGAMIDAAAAGEIDLQQDGGWAIGDRRTITVDGYAPLPNRTAYPEEIDIVISSFDEYMGCGNVLQFDFVRSLHTPVEMNRDNPLVRNYGSTTMYTTTLPALVNALPAWIKNRLQTFSVSTKVRGDDTQTELIPNNKLALRSETEVFGTVEGEAEEGSLIPYYETIANRAKLRPDQGAGIYGSWWLRTPGYSTSEVNYFLCSSPGSSSIPEPHLTAGNPQYTNGVSPFGCLGASSIQPTGIPIDEEHFPGSWFRSYVSSHFDRDGDGWLSDYEISVATYIDMNNSTANKGTVKGIEYFTELVTLKSKWADFTDISFSSFTKLETLEIGDSYERNYNPNENWDLSGCESLKNIVLNSVRIAAISFPASTESINIKCGPGSSLALFPVNVTNCSNLREIKIEPNSSNGPSPIRGINNKQYLETVELPAWTMAGLIDFSGDTSLQSLKITGSIGANPVSQATVNVAGCTALSEINFRNANNLVGTLDLSTLQSIVTVDCRSTGFTGLTLGNNEYLSKLLIYGAGGVQPIEAIDITNCPILVDLVNDYTPTSSGSDDDLLILYGSVSSSPAFMYDSRTKIVTLGLLVNEQPEDVNVEEGEEYSFTFDVSGSNISYSWRKRRDTDSPWVDLETDNETYSGVAGIADNGFEFQCIATNNSGSAISNIVKLTILLPPTIVTNPQNRSAIEGQTVKFVVEATGYSLTYQWQAKDSTHDWTFMRNSNSPEYEVLATISLSGYQYRCCVWNDIGEVFSDPATLTVTADTSVVKPTITTQPVSATVAEGNSATFAVSASGNDISYQWQVFQNNQWTNITGATNSSYTVSAARSLNGSRYRCAVSNTAGAVYSDPATLTVSTGTYVTTPRILTQPKSANVDLGELVTFWVRADGDGLSYQWQRLNGSTWYDITGATGSSYQIMARTEVHNTQYRCVVTNTAGAAYSNSATLSIRAGQELSFYGYHSIIISGKNTYGEWEMYPTSRPHVAPPEVKTSYVDLPGADGGLDYTDLLTGEPRYGYRKGSWEFLLIPQDRWASVYRSLVSFLHGRTHTVILEDDPNFVYKGRLSVNQWQSAAHNSLITIDYILEPFPRDISGEQEDQRTNEILDAANELLSKQENAGMVIAKVSGGAALIDPSMLFENGDNIAY